MTLPHFLIIGAMKAGTTTLFMDLARHPGVFVSKNNKEPHFLGYDHPLPDIAAAYQKIFAGARGHQICGEASTGYTKRPEIEGAAERALELIGPGLKVIYLIRDPIERLLSQYRHQKTAGEITIPLEEAIESHHELIQYSLYGHQAEPWIRSFGAQRVRVIRFEDYTSRRSESAVELWSWLGLDANGINVDEQTIYNKSAQKPVASTGWRKIGQSGFYRRVIRPLLPLELRLRFMQTLLPKSSPPVTDLSEESVEGLIQRFEPDQFRLAEMIDREQPLYSAVELRRQHISRHA